METEDPTTATTPTGPEIVDPRRKDVTDWIVAYVRANPPEPHGVVDRAALQKLTGLTWTDTMFRFSLHDAIRILNRGDGEGKPSLFFRRNEQLGLVRLTEAERIEYAESGRSAIKNKNQWMLEILDKTDVSKLTDDERAKYDKERLRQLHLRREIERVRARKWLGDGDGGDVKRLE